MSPEDVERVNELDEKIRKVVKGTWASGYDIFA